MITTGQEKKQISIISIKLCFAFIVVSEEMMGV